MAIVDTSQYFQAYAQAQHAQWQSAYAGSLLGLGQAATITTASTLQQNWAYQQPICTEAPPNRIRKFMRLNEEHSKYDTQSWNNFEALDKIRVEVSEWLGKS